MLMLSRADNGDDVDADHDANFGDGVGTYPVSSSSVTLNLIF